MYLLFHFVYACSEHILLLLCMYVTLVVVVCFSLIPFIAGTGNGGNQRTCRSTEVPAPDIMPKTNPKVDDVVVVRLQAHREKAKIYLAKVCFLIQLMSIVYTIHMFCNIISWKVLINILKVLINILKVLINVKSFAGDGIGNCDYSIALLN